jgi:hypothetical protein
VVLAGQDVPVIAVDEPAEVKPGSNRTKRLLVAALVGLVIAVGAWQGALTWLQARIPVRVTAAMRMQSANPPKGFEKFEDRVHRRELIADRLTSDLKDNPVFTQVMDFQMAVRSYSNFVGDGRFTSPEVLTSQNIWSRFHLSPFLPPSFTEKTRDGYEFSFIGEGCEEAEAGWPECHGYTYIAKPLKTADGPSPASFILNSFDDSIRVHADGGAPTRTDPVVK